MTEMVTPTEEQIREVSDCFSATYSLRETTQDVRFFNSAYDRMDALSRSLQSLRYFTSAYDLAIFGEAWWERATQNRTYRELLELFRTKLLNVEEDWQSLEQMTNLMRQVLTSDDPRTKAVEVAREYRRADPNALPPPSVLVRQEIRELIRLYPGRVSFYRDDYQPIGEGAHLTARDGSGWRIVLRTEPVSFTEDGVTVNFDGFYIILDSKIVDAESIDFRVTAVRANCANVDRAAIHPHVQSGQVCYGNMTDAVRGALRKGLLSDAFQAAETVLNSYSSAGPFASICMWYGDEQRCAVCNTAIVGDELEEAVSDPFGSGLMHSSCASFDEESSLYYNPAILERCCNCGHDFAAPQMHEMHIEDSHQHTVWVNICSNCRPKLEEEMASASLGIYQCPICGSRHEDFDQARVVLGYQDYGCVSCCRQLDNGQIQLQDGSLSMVVSPCDDIVGGQSPRDRERPIPFVERLTNCDCGRRVSSRRLGQCNYTGGSYCEACNEDGMNVSVQFRRSIPHMDYYKEELVATYLDAFSTDFMQFLSFYDPSISTELAMSILRRIKRCLGESRPHVGTTCLLHEKISWWNDLVRDLDVILVTGIEEQFHDQEVIRRLRTQAEAGDSRAASRLSNLSRLLEQRRNEESQSGEGEDEADDEDEAVYISPAR